MRNHKNHPLYLFLVLFLAASSLGAWWDLGKPKKEEPKEQSQASPVSTSPSSKSTAQPMEAKAPISSSKTDLAPVSVASEKKAIESAASTTKIPTPAQADQIQKELNDIIVRSSKLQNEVKDNRAEILQIMERAKIHDRILKTIKIPPPVTTPVKIVDAEAIVKQEKLRLISQQTQQAQKQLENIQRTRVIDTQRTSN